MVCDLQKRGNVQICIFKAKRNEGKRQIHEQLKLYLDTKVKKLQKKKPNFIPVYFEEIVGIFHLNEKLYIFVCILDNIFIGLKKRVNEITEKHVIANFSYSTAYATLTENRTKEKCILYLTTNRGKQWGVRYIVTYMFCVLVLPVGCF